MRTFFELLRFLYPIVFGAIIAVLWADNRRMRRAFRELGRIREIDVPGGTIEFRRSMTPEEAEAFKQRFLGAHEQRKDDQQ